MDEEKEEVCVLGGTGGTLLSLSEANSPLFYLLPPWVWFFLQHHSLFLVHLCSRFTAISLCPLGSKSDTGLLPLPTIPRLGNHYW